MTLFTEAQLTFIQTQRVARLATADASGEPHVIPVCYACDGLAFYVALDAKPKRVSVTNLKRVRNILANPQVALVIDHYSDDWSQLGYVLVHGSASLLPLEATAHSRAVALLRARYPQYQTMPIETTPIITIQVERVVAWGRFDAPDRQR